MPETNEENTLATILTSLGSAVGGLADTGILPGLGTGLARAVSALLKMGGAVAASGKDVPATVTRLMNEVPLLADVKQHWDDKIAAKPLRQR